VARKQVEPRSIVEVRAALALSSYGLTTAVRGRRPGVEAAEVNSHPHDQQNAGVRGHFLGGFGTVHLAGYVPNGQFTDGFGP
jgi:hypothetical protein